MKRTEILGLASAYGFELAIERPEEKKMRLQGEHTFIDVWSSFKGTTVGVYEPKTKRMWYKKRLDMFAFENLLIEITHHAKNIRD